MHTIYWPEDLNFFLECLAIVSSTSKPTLIFLTADPGLFASFFLIVAQSLSVIEIV